MILGKCFHFFINWISLPTIWSSLSGGKPFRRRSRFSVSFKRDAAESRRFIELKSQFDLSKKKRKIACESVYFDDERVRFEWCDDGDGERDRRRLYWCWWRWSSRLSASISSDRQSTSFGCIWNQLINFFEIKTSFSYSNLMCHLRRRIVIDLLHWERRW